VVSLPRKVRSQARSGVERDIGAAQATVVRGDRLPRSVRWLRK
jgi:hypothetical protein